MIWPEEELTNFFARDPQRRVLFQRALEILLSLYPQLTLTVGKSQITVKDPKGFVYFWLPPRWGIKNRPDRYLVFSFMTGERIHHPRIVEAVEPYPWRWMHHGILTKEEELDDLWLQWIREAHAFSRHRGRKS